MYVAYVADGQDLDAWRDAARPLALAGVAPDEIEWRLGEAPQTEASSGSLSVPRAFVALARDALRHNDPARFARLYALLLRVSRDRRIMCDRSDKDVLAIEALARAVRMADIASSGDRDATWRALAADAAGCTRCPLYRDASRTVFGEGPVDAALMLVGEQPGDREDIEGRPFVGPAGQLLDAALAEAGIERAATYVTNAVKHFKFAPRRGRRIHVKPDAPEIDACRWWQEQERALVRPRVVVALGATAAQSLLGRAVTISRTRDAPVALGDGTPCHVTVHPSYLLRIPDPGHATAERVRFVADLRRARQAAGS